MLVIRADTVFYVITTLCKQTDVVKANLMTGHISVTGKIIDLRCRIDHAAPRLMILISIKNPLFFLMSQAFPVGSSAALALHHSCKPFQHHIVV